MKLAYILLLILILVVAVLTSGCTSTTIQPSVKQDQLILVVPAELLQPIQPLQTIKPNE